jgi:BirA family transcriptional regulator, biotin operon repressor / biotin---[acetyl-CoA-carboxylase] ligase
LLISSWELPHRHVGRRVEVFDRLDSTNSLALDRSRDPSSDGLALLAQEQLAGRGQFGRTWQAPAGSSVLLSVVLFPPPPLRRPALLTAWAAVSVCELIQELTGLDARIKWPNDVLLQDKKVCGILIEQRTAWSGIRQEPAGTLDEVKEFATVAGIGLNVRQEASFFTQAQLPLAGSLFSLTGQLLDSGDVARRLLGVLDDLYASMFQGDTGRLEAMWRNRLGLLGRDVKVDVGSAYHEGRLLEIAFAGLVLELPAGDLLHMLPEAVRHVAISEH